MKEVNAKGFPKRPFKGIKPKEEYKTQILYNRDSKNDELYEVGSVDVQAQVDSYEASALDYILDRFLNHNEIPVVSSVVEHHNTLSKLDECEAAYNYRVAMCEKMGLPIETDILTIRNIVDNKFKEIKESEGETNETKNEPEEVQETL